MGAGFAPRRQSFGQSCGQAGFFGGADQGDGSAVRHEGVAGGVDGEFRVAGSRLVHLKGDPSVRMNTGLNIPHSSRSGRLSLCPTQDFEALTVKARG